MDSIPADKVLKRTQLDFQKHSCFTMCVPNAWRPFFAARHSFKNGLAFLQELDEVGKHWSTGNVEFPCELFSILKVS